MNYKVVSARTVYDTEKLKKMNNFTFLNNNYCKKGQMVLVGDSITELYNHTELFEKYCDNSGVKVYNRGISGDTSDRLLERFEDNVLNISPASIVMLIGTNDLNVGADIYFVLDNITKIIDLTLEKCPSVNFVLLGVYPVGDNQGLRKNSDILRLNSFLARLAQMKNIKYLDLTNELADTDGKLAAEYTYDGLHLNAQGFALVTEKLLPLL